MTTLVRCMLTGALLFKVWQTASVWVLISLALIFGALEVQRIVNERLLK